MQTALHIDRVVELQKFRRSQEEICHEHGRRDVRDGWYEKYYARVPLRLSRLLTIETDRFRSHTGRL